MCGRCLKAKASQQAASDCGATLIICPASILQQWQSEIAKHTQPGALKVITYLGQHKTMLEPAAGSAYIAGTAGSADTAGSAHTEGTAHTAASAHTAGTAGSAGVPDSDQPQSVLLPQLVARGMKRKGKHSGQGVVSAKDLASADVVLTTYDILQRDLHHLSDPEQAVKTLRTHKRYEV